MGSTRQTRRGAPRCVRHFLARESCRAVVPAVAHTSGTARLHAPNLDVYALGTTWTTQRPRYMHQIRPWNRPNLRQLKEGQAACLARRRLCRPVAASRGERVP
jgi:hypothetical protein